MYVMRESMNRSVTCDSGHGVVVDVDGGQRRVINDESARCVEILCFVIVVSLIFIFIL